MAELEKSIQSCGKSEITNQDGADAYLRSKSLSFTIRILLSLRLAVQPELELIITQVLGKKNKRCSADRARDLLDMRFNHHVTETTPLHHQSIVSSQ